MAEGNDGEPQKARPTGEAAWQAHRDAVNQRNAAAKKAAKQLTASERATVARERRLAQIEDAQIRKLNDVDSHTLPPAIG
jgi:hypothetical protein